MNLINFTIVCTPIGPPAKKFSGTVSLTSTSAASPDVFFDIQKGRIAADGTVNASLNQRYSTFNGSTMKGNLTGSYSNGILTLTLTNAEFIGAPTFQISDGFGNINGTINIAFPNVNAKKRRK